MLNLFPALAVLMVAAAAATGWEQAYTKARLAHLDAPTNAVAAWHFSRACFDRAFTTARKSRRAAFAEEGIAAARIAIRLDPKSAPGFYYLALNVGQLASTKTLGALSLVRQMKAHLEQARALDKNFDYGGPDRTLGLLHRDAPGWPLSVGSRKQARRHLEQALALAPEYFENHLNLLETLLSRRDWKAVRRVHAAALKALSKARQEFSGDRWAASWADWNARWAKVDVAVRHLKKAGS